jgi:hypothetical protein
MISGQVIVNDEHFAYLRLQKGSLEPLAGDCARWHAAYEADLWRTYLEIRTHLPEACSGASLDIGSGLGGIDVLLSRHYGGELNVNLLDGERDAPVMALHRETFSSEAVARDFLIANGVPANRIGYYTPASASLTKVWDLVLSLGSWCFHYAPDAYLPRLLEGGGLHSDTVIILDVRRDKGEWASQLNAHLREVASIRITNKWARGVYALR